MSRFLMQHSAWALLVVAIVILATDSAQAARWLNGNRAPAQTTVGRSSTPGPTGMANGYNRGNSSGGWTRENSWYNIPQYGNYAPPPYATSRSALIQIGPLPAFGGVRSLPGWGGAR